MLSRRTFMQLSILLGYAGFTLSGSADNTQGEVLNKWYMPDESEQHKRTWMSFIASYEIWSESQVPEVHRNLAAIATTIAKYEPVSLLVRREDYNIAQELLGGLDNHPHPIELIEFEMNDLWMRDTGPTFVVNRNGKKAAVNFNFNGWGEDQVYEYDAKVASFVAKKSKVKDILSSLILEGGCFEVDGQGTAILTESCILNSNRNPTKTKIEVESEMMELLGLDKIIWLKGVKGKDITDGHTDFYARFAKPGSVVVSRDMDISSYDYKITRENIGILQSSRDARGNQLEVIALDTPWTIETRYGINDFAAGYVGYYVCNGAVIMQKFGDVKADRLAKQKVARAFPDHTIEQLAINGIASGGGSIHCTTQQEPKV